MGAKSLMRVVVIWPLLNPANREEFAMRSVGGGLIVVGVILLAAPLTAFAQEATVSGT
jgi:hypothetical protein